MIWPDARPWPTASNGNPLTAVLELFVDELPVVPAALVGVQRMQVFLELTEAKPPPARGYFTQRSYPLGGAHRVVTHREANGGPRFEGVSDDHVVSLVARLVPTYPTGEAVRHLPKDLAAAFRRLPSSGALFGDRIRSEPFPHVGGWPHALGDGDGLGDGDEIGDFVMQLDGELLGVDLGPDGQLYFGIDEGEWKMSRVVG
ncbi:MAG: hypothetical protein H6721_16880 [Sandaracinus sp.]|nr:hypothetical protein [Sandaracinus sp.]